MIAKIKEWGSLFLGALTLVLGGLFLSQRRKTDNAESELAREKTTTEITLNEQAREDAKDNADALLDEYERSKR